MPGTNGQDHRRAKDALKIESAKNGIDGTGNGLCHKTQQNSRYPTLLTLAWAPLTPLAPSREIKCC